MKIDVAADNYNVERDGFLVSTDISKFDLALIHNFLSQSYWSEQIPREVVWQSMENSLCFGVYEREKQLGFARVISDFTTFAYLADVFVLAEYRGRGLSKFLMESIMNHPQLQNLRRWMLATRDAHGLYQQYGFQPLKNPSAIMEIAVPDIYTKLVKE